LVASSGPLIANVDPTAMAVAIKAIVQNGLEAVQKDGHITVGVEEFKVQGSTIKVDGPHGLSTPHCAFCTPHSGEGPMESGAFILAVADTGPGIPADVRPNIFDPFFCGREAGRGLGLGLSKAWRIIDLHGGRIEVDSEAGSGATFRVILPGGHES